MGARQPSLRPRGRAEIRTRPNPNRSPSPNPNPIPRPDANVRPTLRPTLALPYAPPYLKQAKPRLHELGTVPRLVEWINQAGREGRLIRDEGALMQATPDPEPEPLTNALTQATPHP